MTREQDIDAVYDRLSWADEDYVMQTTADLEIDIGAMRKWRIGNEVKITRVMSRVTYASFWKELIDKGYAKVLSPFESEDGVMFTPDMSNGTKS
jgi:hypothetical protein